MSFEIEHGVGAKTAAARGVAIARPPRASQFLDQLLKESSAEVLRQAVQASGEIGYEGSISRLIPMLAHARLRRDAREALLKLGAPALSELRERFQDETVPIEVRFRIPKVLSLSHKQDAADFLFGCLRHFSPRLDTAILKALNVMRSESSEIHFDRDRVSALIGMESNRHQRLRAIRRAIQGNLDSENSALVLNMFQELNYRFNQTIIMITHNPEAAAMCKRIVQMRDGHIVEQTPTVRL